MEEKTATGIFDGEIHDALDRPEESIVIAHTIEQLAHGKDSDEIFDLLLKYKNICLLFPAYSMRAGTPFDRWDQPDGFIAVALCPECHNMIKIKYDAFELYDVFFKRKKRTDTFSCTDEQCKAQFIIEVRAENLIGNSIFDFMAKLLIKTELAESFPFVYEKDQHYAAALLHIVQEHKKLRQALSALVACTEKPIDFAATYQEPYCEGHDPEIVADIKKYRQAVEWLENGLYEKLEKLQVDERW